MELSYQTIWGHQREVSPESANAIASSLLGTPIQIDEPEQVQQALSKSATSDTPAWARLKTLVESAASPLQSLAEVIQSAATPIECYIEWENSSITICPWNDRTIQQLATPGYHWLTLRTATQQARIRWILAPDQCYLPPSTQPLNGINCFLPSLRSYRNWGVGDLTDLIHFAQLLSARIPLDFIALNPLHAIHNRTPYNTSPYLPLSIFTHNFLYLDIEAIPDFKQSQLAKSIAESTEFQTRLTALRSCLFVDYEQTAKLKLFFLALLYRQFLKQSPQTLDQYKQKRGPWLINYCKYMALDRYFHRRNPDAWHWHHWPIEFQSPDSPECQALCLKLQRQINFYAYIEMRLEQQISTAHKQVQTLGYSIGLYHDLALATDRVGADYWAYQNLFAPGVRVGSPPDDFNENGQDWGFPALHPQRHSDSGYTYFIESIRCAARHGGAIRLDHVMRLARLYWIPDNVSARDGAYVRDRFEDLLRILALESSRGKFMVVGEDLGTVPEYFRKALHAFCILSYRLILFERNGEDFRPAKDFPVLAIASFTTHDLSTFDGWLTGADLKARFAIGHLSQSDYHQALQSRAVALNQLRHAFQISDKNSDANQFFSALCTFLNVTPSLMRLVNLEELCAEQEQQNLPGTTSEAPNWQRRSELLLENFLDDSTFAKRLNTWAASLKSKGLQ